MQAALHTGTSWSEDMKHEGFYVLLDNLMGRRQHIQTYRTESRINQTLADVDMGIAMVFSEIGQTCDEVWAVMMSMRLRYRLHVDARERILDALRPVESIPVSEFQSYAWLNSSQNPTHVIKAYMCLGLILSYAGQADLLRDIKQNNERQYQWLAPSSHRTALEEQAARLDIGPLEFVWAIVNHLRHGRISVLGGDIHVECHLDRRHKNKCDQLHPEGPDLMILDLYLLEDIANAIYELLDISVFLNARGK